MGRFSFPIYKTKVEGVTQNFNLDNPAERQKYFDAKAGAEIKKLREWAAQNRFIAFLIGKKGSGKGTYAKLFMEVFGDQRAAHLSVGDVIRATHQSVETPEGEKDLLNYLNDSYRGFTEKSRLADIIRGRDLKTLIPTEVVLTLIKREVSRYTDKSLFVDGFPRNLDQIPYSLYFRDIVGRPQDRDLFIFIDTPKVVANERVENRVVCPQCQTPRNLKLFRTADVGYDQDSQQFYLKCDNSPCKGTRMVTKEGKDLNPDSLRERAVNDEKVMETLLQLKGVPKVFLRSSLPIEAAAAAVDPFEITPAYRYKWDKDHQKVQVLTEPWVIRDDQGVPSYSLLAPPVVVALIKQMAQVLGL